MSIARDLPTNGPGSPSDERAAVPQRGNGHEAITRAAREVFAEHGYHGASVRDIAKRAGLSLSALYYWYPGKQQLLAALIEDSDRDYHARCERELSAAGDNPVEQLRALVHATVEYRIERRIESSIAVLEYRNLEPESAARLAKQTLAARKIWTDVVNDGVASGTFRCTHADDARRTIIAACNAIAQWYRPGGKLTTAELVDRYTDIALRVVDARP